MAKKIYINKKLIIELNLAYNEYIKTFLEHSEIIRNDHFREIKFYKTNGFNKNYDRDLELYKEWCKKWYHELHYFIYILNLLIEKINYKFNFIECPDVIKNKYLFEDTQGVYNSEGKPMLYLPRKMKRKK